MSAPVLGSNLAVWSGQSGPAALMATSATGFRLNSIYTPLTDLFEALGILAVLGVGAWKMSLDRLTIEASSRSPRSSGFLYSPSTCCRRCSSP
jgi:hypothetical protein